MIDSASAQKNLTDHTTLASHVDLIVAGLAEAAIQLDGTWVGTVQFEGTVDNDTWVALGMALSTTPGTLVTSATGNGVWVGPCAGLYAVRARCSAFTSGVIAATVQAAVNAVSLSPAVSIPMAGPTGLAAVAAGGGSLGAGTYYFVLTSLDQVGGETSPSNEVSVHLNGTTQTAVALSWSQTNLPFYRIYKGTGPGAENKYFDVTGDNMSLTWLADANVDGFGDAATTGGPPARVGTAAWSSLPAGLQAIAAGSIAGFTFPFVAIGGSGGAGAAANGRPPMTFIGEDGIAPGAYSDAAHYTGGWGEGAVFGHDNMLRNTGAGTAFDAFLWGQGHVVTVVDAADFDTYLVFLAGNSHVATDGVGIHSLKNIYAFGEGSNFTNPDGTGNQMAIGFANVNHHSGVVMFGNRLTSTVADQTMFGDTTKAVVFKSGAAGFSFDHDIKIPPIAIASLPASPAAGMFATVNDALNPVIGSTVASGGAAYAAVTYNGANWTVIGK